MSRAQLFEWNLTECEYPREATIAALFEAQAAKTPGDIALITGDRRLTYREVSARVRHLARRLQGLGVSPDSLVGVALDRSELLVISLLAVLKAGGAYVPLDPEFPRERVAAMIEDSGMGVLLTGAGVLSRLQLGTDRCQVLDVSEITATWLEDSPDVDSDATSQNLAYVIYTSGSTGKPKGVMVENRNVANFFAGMDQVIGAEPGVWLAVTSYSFDISVLELLWTLCRGFSVVIHNDRDFTRISQEIVRNRVTHLQMTPSLARILTLDSRAYASLGALKKILLGGEAVPAALIHHLRKVYSGEIYNMYGPTETTIWSTVHKVETIGTSVPIGKPIANTQVYVLDADKKDVALGEPGELYIGGDGLARGYWARPELTAERFVPIPWEVEKRMYRTGDLARFNPEGDLEFLGRADYQVKLRGHRIEPGEIEATLEASAGVRQAVVVLREDREGDARLVAYIVSDQGKQPRPEELRAVLAAKVPDYMVPSAFAFLSELPLTDNGKIDRKAILKLPPPQSAQPDANVTSGQADSTDLEKMVAAVWREALNVEAIGMDDNFFDLGAHSLMVAEVHARLQNVLGREISLVDLFQYSTAKALAQHLSGLNTQTRISDRALRRRMARTQSA